MRFELPYRPWLHVLAIVLVLGTFILVGVGGNVTSLDAGMAVPDWPGTFGYNMFLAPPAVWFQQHGTFWEHTHRLIGSAVGLVMIALAVGLWTTQRPPAGRPWLRWFGLTLLGMIIIQGLMGGFRVTENSPFLAALHGIFGQIVLAVTVLLAAAVGPVWISVINSQRNAPTSPSLSNRPPASEDTPRRGLLNWDILLLAGLVLLGLIASMILGADDEELIIWSVSDVGLVWIACMAAYMGICIWRLSGVLRDVPADARWSQPRHPSFVAAMVLLVLLVGQLVLGAAVRHSGAEHAIPDAPLAYGQVLPPLTPDGLDAAIERVTAGSSDLQPPPPTVTLGHVWLHWVHRAWAVVVAGAVVGVAISVWRRRLELDLRILVPPLILVIALTAFQIMLGVMTVWSNIYPTMATYHQATGAALLAFTAWLAIRAHLSANSAHASPAAVAAPENVPDASGYNVNPNLPGKTT